MGMDIDVHFNRLGPSGATLVVVAVGREVFGATNPEPFAALHTAAREAAEGLPSAASASTPRSSWSAGTRSGTLA